MSEQIVKFAPAFDKTSDDPSKNYGIASMRIWFYLKGDLAVVQFNISTGWYLQGSNSRVILGQLYDIAETDPAVLKRMREYSGLFGGRPETHKVVLCDYYNVKDALAPQGWDVGYHSPVALYEDQGKMEECEFFPGNGCYYDGSSLRAQEWVKKFIGGGTDWLWTKMEEELAEIEQRV